MKKKDLSKRIRQLKLENDTNLLLKNASRKDWSEINKIVRDYYEQAKKEFLLENPQGWFTSKI